MLVSSYITSLAYSLFLPVERHHRRRSGWGDEFRPQGALGIAHGEADDIRERGRMSTQTLVENNMCK